MKKHIGQSIIEVVMLVGVMFFILTGIVATILTVSKGRTSAVERKKATELATYLSEQLVAEESNSPATFWNNMIAGQTCRSSDVTPCYTIPSSYSSYTWTVTKARNTTNCSVATCGQATIVVTWIRQTTNSVTFTRYFSRGY